MRDGVASSLKRGLFYGLTRPDPANPFLKSFARTGLKPETFPCTDRLPEPRFTQAELDRTAVLIRRARIEIDVIVSEEIGSAPKSNQAAKSVDASKRPRSAQVGRHSELEAYA